MVDAALPYLSQHLFELLNVLVIATSAFLLWRQIRETHEWKRLKTTQEVLSKISEGPFQDMMHTIRFEFGCDVLAASPGLKYNEFTNKVPPDKQERFRRQLLKCSISLRQLLSPYDIMLSTRTSHMTTLVRY